jgi:hypothetical protein
MIKYLIIAFFSILIVKPALYSQDSVITVWSYEYEYNYDESPLEVKQFNNYFYILNDIYSSSDFSLIKLDADGNLLWRQIFNFGDNHNYIGNFEIIDENNFLFTIAQTDTLACNVILSDSVGNTIWSKYYLGSEQGSYLGAYAKDIVYLDEQNIYLTGSRADSVFLFKINIDGDLIWSNVFQNFDNFKTDGRSIGIKSNGDILIGVQFRRGLWDSDTRVGVYNCSPIGNLENIIIYSDSSSKQGLVEMMITESDQIYLVGEGYNSPNFIDAFITKVNSDGNLLWTQYFGSPNYDNIFGASITVDNEILVCGNKRYWEYYPHNDIWAFKIDSSGNLLWNYVKESDGIQRLVSIIPINDSDYLIVGQSLSNSIYDFDSVIAERLHELQLSNQEEHSIAKHFKINSIYPNPINPSTNISYTNPTNSNVEINIYDLKGQHIKTLLNDNLREGNHMYHWNAKNMASGVYFISIESDKFIDSKKIVLLK